MRWQPVTGFFTSWGDGAFPVYRESDATGALCRIRVELGAPEIVRRSRRMDELWFGELSKLAIVSSDVSAAGTVGWMYRHAPDNDRDSGWRVFSGRETREFVDDPDNAGLVPLRELIAQESALEACFKTPAPVAFERRPDGSFAPCPPPASR